MMTSLLLHEYDSREIDCPPPTPGDLTLAADLAAGGELAPRLDVEWLLGGRMRVNTHSWVGVVRFSAVEIRVVPKLIGNSLRVLRMIEYAEGVRLIKRLPTDRPLPADGTDLFDLIVMLLTEEVKALIRNGLIRDYRSVEDSLDVLRGRLRIREQYLRRYGQLHRVECAFDEFDGDVPENQLLAAALQAAETRVGDMDVRNGARAFGGVLREVCEVRTRDTEWYVRTIRYGRRNAGYRSAHELAKLVLKGLALNDHVDKSTLHLTSFMIDMNAIFERFITKLVINSLAGKGLRARAQQTVPAVIVDEGSGQTYSTIRPDILIEDSVTGRSVPVDVKYKLYDDSKKVSTADIYQLFVYAYAVGAQTDSARAALIYPAVSPVSGPALYVKPLANATPARIRGAGIDVSGALEAVNSPAESLLHAQVYAIIQEITGMHGDSNPKHGPELTG
jgi:5-methylcytosine-specific restriction enzyme subunit McrC